MFTAVRSRRWSHLALVVALAALVVLALAACGSSTDESASPQPQVQADQLIVATTTSLNDSGLLEDVVLPAYEEQFPDVTVKVVAVGSGEAMAMGAKGEADVLLVHSPDDEEQFMADGNGTLRLPFAYNYFVIVGPKDDPAGVAKAEDASAAFTAIAGSKSTFVSRGDESGTNKKELKIWESAGITPEGDWYIITGQGMGETLRITSEKQGYTLTDLGTFLSQQDTLDLARALQGDGGPEEHLRRHHREPEQVPHGERCFQRADGAASREQDGPGGDRRIRHGHVRAAPLLPIRRQPRPVLRGSPA